MTYEKSNGAYNRNRTIISINNSKLIDIHMEKLDF